MTAYRSSNDYRQDTLRYDGGTNVTVAPAVIAATSSVPAVSIAVDQTVSASIIATAATTPAVTVRTGVTVSVTTVSTSGLIPDPTVTEGIGVTVTPAAVAATATIPDPTVTEGTGVSVAPSQINGSSTVPSLDLSMRYVQTLENILPQLDVVPYFTNDPARRLARFRTPGLRGRNVFILTSGAVTTRQPVDPALVSRELLGGHESPTDLTSEELNALIGAGFAVEVR